MRPPTRPPGVPSLLSLLPALALAGACSSKQPAPVSPQAPAPPASPASPASPGNAPAGDEGAAGGERPPGVAAPRVVLGCLVDVYAGCAPTVGLPALSADGARVAVPDFGPDSPRDQRILTVRILDVDQGVERRALPILGYEDYAQGVDDMSGEVSPALRAALAQRIEALDRVLAKGRYRPLTALGTVHEEGPGQEVDGLRASFDGKALAVLDLRDGRVRWRRAIGPSPAWKPDPDLEDLSCGPFPVAEVSVWASREPSVIVALVTYMGADLCATEYPFLVWR